MAVPIVLLNERFLEWSVLAAGVLLAYLGVALPREWRPGEPMQRASGEIG